MIILVLIPIERSQRARLYGNISLFMMNDIL
jgi:hypothetical protein